ncbi:eukaryotic peptide chain release factor subunit 1-1 [Capsella rubella]|nr:eukaryotic peptide chain release factor subunit 1-1 [Capsella rubella]
MGNMESDDKFGFVVMDGNGALFTTLSGSTRELLHKLSYDHPKKLGSGLQAARMSYLVHMEMLDSYLSKIGALATQYYINPLTGQPNVTGLILAGSSDVQVQLMKLGLFDHRLVAKLVNVVEVSYGVENGFNQAIEQLSDILANGKYTRERYLMDMYFGEVRKRPGKYVFGVDGTMNVLESKPGAVKTLIVWDNLDINRYVMKNSLTGETVIKYLNKEQEGNTENYKDLDVEEKMPLLEWLANENRRFGCAPELVTNKSWESYQFCKGFEGIGAILDNRIALGDGEDT